MAVVELCMIEESITKFDDGDLIGADEWLASTRFPLGDGFRVRSS